jgi:hypothetical protein
MAGLDPAIHETEPQRHKTWITGSRADIPRAARTGRRGPAMTGS